MYIAPVNGEMRCASIINRTPSPAWKKSNVSYAASDGHRSVLLFFSLLFRLSFILFYFFIYPNPLHGRRAYVRIHANNKLRLVLNGRLKNANGNRRGRGFRISVGEPVIRIRCTQDSITVNRARYIASPCPYAYIYIFVGTRMRRLIHNARVIVMDEQNRSVAQHQDFELHRFIT